MKFLNIFAIKFNKVIDCDDYLLVSYIEYFDDEVKFKTRLTELQDDYDIKDIEKFGGSLTKIDL